MNDHGLVMSFAPLYSDKGDFEYILSDRPKFAHYTSLHSLEKILVSEELWFSNPLFMNDLEEMHFGITEGVKLFNESKSKIVAAVGSAIRFQIVEKAFLERLYEFDARHAIDTFVFCASSHETNNTDGVLSMWRAYGGNGNGAALVFNTEHITTQKSDSPLIMARVHYDSGAGRKAWLDQRIDAWCNAVFSLNLDDRQIAVTARVLFSIIQVYAVTSKHHGFSEEKEWRLIYMPERDIIGFREKNLHYIVGKNGIEPKLRFPIAPLPLSDPEHFTFDSIISQIILGPSLSSPLARTSVIQMLKVIKKPNLIPKVSSSTIPLRPS